VTPSHGTPTIGDQASYDADQDRRIRRLRAQGAVAIACLVLVGAAAAWRVSPRPVALPPPPVVHVAAPPACPQCPACPACPATSRHQ
jgi:hypothetical protein